jgi:hypothetical protein
MNEKYKANNKKVKMLRRIMLDSVDDMIGYEIRDDPDPIKMMSKIRLQFEANDEATRLELMKQVQDLKLWKCQSVSDYITQHRLLRLDLIRAKLSSYTEAQMATYIIAGLPKTANWETFCRSWEWTCAEKGGIDLNLLFNRLVAEEERIKTIKKSPTVSTKPTFRKAFKDDLVCTFPSCRLKGHDEDHCWKKHPELKKNRSNDKYKSKNKRIIAMAKIEKDPFYALMAEDDESKCAFQTPTLVKHPMTDLSQDRQGGKTSKGKETLLLMSIVLRILEGIAGVLLFLASTPTIVKRVYNTRRSWYCPLSILACNYTSDSEIDKDTWLIDSGANVPIVNNKKWFTTFRKFNYKASVASSNSYLQIEGGGDVELSISLGDKKTTLVLTRVAYAPMAQCNLISLSALATQANIKARVDKDRMVLTTSTHEDFAEATFNDGLYVLQLHPHQEKHLTDMSKPLAVTTLPPVTQPMVAVIDYMDNVWRWHRRLGHLGWQSMRWLLTRSDGIKLTDQQLKNMVRTVCPVCAVSRATTKVPREPARRRAQHLGELIHADAWGPYSIEGYDGSTRALVFVDDATRFTWIRLFKQKGDVVDKFKELHRSIERQFGVEIRAYRFDGEFQIGEVKDWVTRKSIAIQTVLPDQHHMAGVVERSFRTIREKAAPMVQERTISGQLFRLIDNRSQQLLRETTIPENLWPEAFRHAVWLKNRSPSRALKGKITPWEALFGQKPCLEKERIWGSRIFVTFPPEQRGLKVHDPRGWMGYWIGREDEAVERVYAPDQAKVFRISYGRIDEGVGLDDPHIRPSLNDRDPVPSDLSADEDITSDDASNSDSDISETHTDPNPDKNRQEPNILDDAVAAQRLAISLERRQDPRSDQEAENNYDDDSLSQQMRALGYDEEEDNQSTATDPNQAGSNDQFLEDEESEPNHHNNDSSDSADDHETTSNMDDDALVRNGLKSRFFLAAAKPRKRPMNLESLPPIRFDRCWYCWRYKKNCDGERPCEMCVKQRRRCRDLTDEDVKKLYPNPKPEDYYVPLIQPDKAENQCRTCYMRNIRCIRDSPGEKCRACVRDRTICTMDLTGADNTKVYQRYHQEKKPREEASETSDPCDRCRKHRLKCDGKHPCNNCARKPGNKKSEQHHCRYGDKICNGCRNGRYLCDGKRPCGHCRTAKKTCTWLDQQGLVLRRYGVPGGTNHRLPPLEESDDECSECRHRKRRCDGQQPCYRCVKHKHAITSPCTYRHTGQWADSYTTAPFELRDDTVRLREDWEDILSLRHKKGNQNDEHPRGGNVTQVRPKDIPKPANPIAEDRDADADSALLSAFPEGRERIATRGDGLLCGIRAVAHSIGAQMADIHTPNTRTLQALLETDDFTRMFNEELGAEARENESDYFIDQLGAILNIWGLQQHPPRHLRLGYVLRDGRAFRLPTAYEDATTVWIASNSLSGITAEDGEYNHYEGLRRKNAPKKTDAQKRKRARTRDSSSDGSSSEASEEETLLDNDIDELFNADTSQTKPDSSKLSKKKARILLSMANILDGPEPQTFTEAMRRPDCQLWKDAIGQEIQSLDENKVFEVTDPPPERRCFTSRWVFKKKIGNEGQTTRYKARLVARGFTQEEGIDYEETFSSVVKSSSYKFLFAMAALLGLRVYLMDVKTAFLHGNLEQDLYMKAPPGFPIEKGKVLRLVKAIYGLKQAPRQWYSRLRSEMEKMNFRPSNFDTCVFIHNTYLLIVAIWVDDLLIFGRDERTIEAFKKQMTSTFTMTDEGLCRYYLGMNIEQGNGYIKIHQKRYAKQILDRFGFTNLLPARTPMREGLALQPHTGEVNPQLKRRYQSMIGSLLYLSNSTRPDICFAVNMCARFTANPTQAHIDAVTQIFAYVKDTTDVGLRYERPTSEGYTTEITGWVDADFAGDPETRRSTTGYIFMLANAPIAWASRRQTAVATATMDAEYMAGAEAAKEAVWLRWFAEDTGLLKQQVVVLYTDNNAALKLSRNPENHRRAKHIDIKYHFLREHVVDLKDLETRRVSTEENIADILTKALGRIRFTLLMGKMNLVENTTKEPGNGRKTGNR